jgi:hypothetical protein
MRLTDSISEKPLPAPAAMPPTIMLELKLLTLDLRAIADAKVDFPITPDRPADVSKGGLISVQLGEKEAGRLVETVLSIKGAELLSQPQIVTLDGQEASLQVGGELPITEVLEIVGDERRERRVEFKSFGTKLRVLPHIVPENRRSVLIEIAGEKTSVNPAWKPGDDAKFGPLLSTHKIELAATVELGKTLVLLSPAIRDNTADPAAKAAPESLLILLRPSVVEHKYVEVRPNPNGELPSTAARTRYTQVRAAAGEEAKLAEQLRSIRQAVEELARERETNRKENAALRAELEQLKRSQRPAAAPELRGDVEHYPRAGAIEAVLAADPQVPPATIQRAIEWLRARQPDGQWQLAEAANAPSARGRLTQRKLLELDLQAAELELQAAQEDLDSAEKLNQQNAISAEELRNRRRLVEKTRIQVAKLRVMLEAESEAARAEPPAKPNPAPSK